MGGRIESCLLKADSHFVTAFCTHVNILGIGEGAETPSGTGLAKISGLSDTTVRGTGEAGEMNCVGWPGTGLGLSQLCSPSGQAEVRDAERVCRMRVSESGRR